MCIGGFYQTIGVDFILEVLIVMPSEMVIFSRRKTAVEEMGTDCPHGPVRSGSQVGLLLGLVRICLPKERMGPTVQLLSVSGLFHSLSRAA